MRKVKTIKWLLLFAIIGLSLMLNPARVLANEKKPAHAGKSSDEIAKELSNPAGSLASLSNNLQYTDFQGSLPDADDQNSWSYSFQPVLPFPVGGKGRRIIFRPLVPVPLDQPVFDLEKKKFENAGVNLGDITFDLSLRRYEHENQARRFFVGCRNGGDLSHCHGQRYRRRPVALGP